LNSYIALPVTSKIAPQKTEFMLRILIADDHDIIRDALKHLLEEEFPILHIEEASNTATLIGLAFDHSWDIIISDVKMPGGGGFVALQEIKNKKPEIPVIIISSNTEEDYGDRALKAGAEKFINKASLSEDLVKAIKGILNGKV
jgi:two-component system, NarL family, invasion response regulator UvrY